MDMVPGARVEGSGSQEEPVTEHPGRIEPVNEQSESVGQLEGRIRWFEKAEGPGCFQQCINGEYRDIPVVREEVEVAPEQTEAHQEA